MEESQEVLTESQEVSTSLGESPGGISFDKKTRKFTGIKYSQARFWQDSFPDIGIHDLISRIIPAWLDANPRGAPKKDWKRFLVNWFKSEQKRKEREKEARRGSVFHKTW